MSIEDAKSKIKNLFNEVRAYYIGTGKITEDSYVESGRDVHAYFFLADQKTGIHLQGYPQFSDEKNAYVWACLKTAEQLRNRKDKGNVKEHFENFKCGIKIPYNEKSLEEKLEIACPQLKSIK